MNSYNLSKGSKIVCSICKYNGDYDKPTLHIGRNGTSYDYFKKVASIFEHQLEKVGLNSLMTTVSPESISYRMPDSSWWNFKEKRWVEPDEYNTILNNIFTQIREDYNAGLLD